MEEHAGGVQALRAPDLRAAEADLGAHAEGADSQPPAVSSTSGNGLDSGGGIHPDPSGGGRGGEFSYAGMVFSPERYREELQSNQDLLWSAHPRTLDRESCIINPENSPSTWNSPPENRMLVRVCLLCICFCGACVSKT